MHTFYSTSEISLAELHRIFKNVLFVLAHLSRWLIGECIVYTGIRRPSVNILKLLLLSRGPIYLIFHAYSTYRCGV